MLFFFNGFCASELAERYQEEICSYFVQAAARGVILFLLVGSCADEIDWPGTGVRRRERHVSLLVRFVRCRAEQWSGMTPPASPSLLSPPHVFSRFFQSWTKTPADIVCACMFPSVGR